jgi:NADH-quinone oxidoreductase subunit F
MRGSATRHPPSSLALFGKLKETIARERADGRMVLAVSAGTCGRVRGALKVADALAQEIERRRLGERALVKITGCHGFCQAEPNIVVRPGGIFYQQVGPADAAEIIEETVIAGRVVERLLHRDPVSGERIAAESEVPFYKRQVRTLLAASAWLDPTSIEDYLAIGGYAGLTKALGGMRSADIIDEVSASGLRGRGGAGFPTGAKWRFLSRAAGKEKYLICNADEGDPGAYMDRSLLEGNPHLVLEGMIIGAYATGANRGYIYVRDEYPLAVAHAARAIEQARRYGLLGENILGFRFDFDVEVCRGAGAFVCGEETALIHSIEGAMGEPRQRPPFPVSRGLFGKPTNINNVETWANVPHIIIGGAEWFASIGTEKSKGTKIFSLVGKINNTGLVEVPMGMSLRQVIFDIGAGIPGNKAFKAVQTGGPSGGCIPAQLLDMPVDYEALAEAGAMMGSGGMVVMDEDTCMVDVARYFLEFLRDESCGKCFSCRKGIQRMLEIVTAITHGQATLADLDLLAELAQVVCDASMCGLGKTASNPVLSTLRYFRSEYESHISLKKCPAKVCKELIHFRIIPERCTGCQRCVAVCPTQAISGPRSQPHSLDLAKCIKCRVCYEICAFEAIEDQILEAIEII